MNYVEVNHQDKRDSLVWRRTHFMRFSNFVNIFIEKNGPIEITSFDNTIWNAKSMTRDIIIWLPAWYTNNAPVQRWIRLFQKNSLVKLFYLKWSCHRSLKLKLYFIVKATHWRRKKNSVTKKVLKAGQAKCLGATQNKTFSKNILAKLFYINRSWLNIFK